MIKDGMNYKIGDIVLIRFPFTDLIGYKKRPVLIIGKTKYEDILCFQITSNRFQSNIVEIDNKNLDGELPFVSFVKYDKCFTLEENLIIKKVARVKGSFLQKLKKLFCDNILKD